MSGRPWLKHYPEGLDWHMPIKARPLSKILEEAAGKWPDAPHMTFMGRSFTYRESLKLVRRAARGFQALGVKKGVHVGLYLPNCPQFVICYYAILMAGGTVVNFSPLYSVPELLRQVEDSKTEIMVTLDLKQLYPNMAKVLAESSLRMLVVSSLADVLSPVKALLFRLFKSSMVSHIPDDDAHIRYSWLMGKGEEPEPVTIDVHDDVAVLQYTGGTTGTPKGAMLTHANLSVNAAQTLYWDPSFRPGKEVMMGVLPLFHVFAMTLVMNASMIGGAHIVMMPKFELEEALKLASRYKVTLMPGVPVCLRPS